MEKRYISLGSAENSRIIKLIRIAFGIVCIVVAAFWIIFNISTIKTDGTVWFTIAFLLAFGTYQIMEGLGYTKTFIEFNDEAIRIKKNPFLPLKQIKTADLEKIELYPLNVIFFLKTGKKVMLRFGTTYFETNELITDELFNFSDNNSIPLEVIEEKI
jgi:hypothetical protein